MNILVSVWNGVTITSVCVCVCVCACGCVCMHECRVKGEFSVSHFAALSGTP